MRRSAYSTRQRETGEHRRAIHEHRAYAAFAQLAAVLGAGEREILAQHLEQRLVGRESDLAAFAVHDERGVRGRASGRFDLDGFGHA